MNTITASNSTHTDPMPVLALMAVTAMDSSITI
jgi:hypothetical protein